MSTQNTVKTDYTSDSRCLRCDVKFGFGFPKYIKRHCCKFCGRGVCSSCSPQRVPNPETSRIDRICNVCYQRVMTNHFKKSLNQEIDDLKKQRSEFYFSLGQEIKNRAKICTKKRILEGILHELENEAEKKDREQRTCISKLKAEKDSKINRMEAVVKKYHESQREIERKEKKLKEVEQEGLLVSEKISGQVLGISEHWVSSKTLREKKVKLLKKCQILTSGAKNVNSESYSELISKYNENFAEIQHLVDELSQLTAELEMKDQKIRALQKKLIETAINTEEEEDSASILRNKIEEQKRTIENLNNEILAKEEEPIQFRVCRCLAF